jgi:hypothetical protein
MICVNILTHYSAAVSTVRGEAQFELVCPVLYRIFMGTIYMMEIETKIVFWFLPCRDRDVR